MSKKTFLFIALLCAVAQRAWAQSPTVVSTESELTAAFAYLIPGSL